MTSTKTRSKNQKSSTGFVPKARVKRPDGKKEVFSSFEGEFPHFLGLIAYRIDGRDFAGILCKKGEKSYRIQFPFRCNGISASLTDEEADLAWEKLDSGLKQLLAGEVLTYKMRGTSDDLPHQLVLSRLQEGLESKRTIDSLDKDLLGQLILSQKSRVQKLAASGLFQPKNITAVGSYTSEDTEQYDDFIEKGIGKFMKFFRKKVTGEYEQVVYEHLLDIVHNSYFAGFRAWEALLNEQSGMISKAMTIQEVWEDLWYRFNSTPPPDLPNYLVFDESGLGEVSSTDRSLISVLMESPSSIPVASRDCIYVNGAFEGVMILDGKPKGWVDIPDQLKYLWNATANIPDIEIVTQIRMGDQAALESNLIRQTSQAVSRASYAASKNTVSARAGVDLEEAIDAQQLLYKGAASLSLATVAIIRRRSKDELDQACNTFASRFFRPTTWVYEKDYAWIPWLQCLTGLRWDLLNVSPFDRQRKFLTHEAPGLLPLMTATGKDRRGLFLLTAEGANPVYVDIFADEPRHMGIFGATRSGKSVLVEAIILYALALGFLVSIVDYPREDGTGTFSEFVPLLGGSYFSPTNESINIFELPDLRNSSIEIQERRMKDYKEALLEILLEMVRREGEDFRPILSTLLTAFFDDPIMERRYNEANNNGFGSQSWSAMPTLRDFLPFCSKERLGASIATPEMIRSLELIRIGLEGWINGRIGDSISRPSTVPLNSPLFAIALSQLSNQNDSKIMAMAINLLITRRQYACPRSITIFDESPILFQFEAIAAQIGRMTAAGAKGGTGVIILAQEPQSIASSPSGSKVLAAMSAKLIGRIEAASVDAFSNLFKIPWQTVSRCASPQFERVAGKFYSQWLLVDGDLRLFCRYYPSFLELAAVANNRPESEVRQKHLRECGGDKLLALTRTAAELFTNKRKLS